MQLMKILWERREFFGVCLLEHIRISLTAVLCAGVLGIAIGIWISRHKKAAGIILGIINVIYTIPSISLLGFLIPFTGIGNKTAIIALTVWPASYREEYLYRPDQRGCQYPGSFQGAGGG